MKTNPNKLWLVVIALGLSFDFLFWKRTPGVNFAVFVALCVAGAFFLLLGEGLRPNWKSLVLIPFIGFFASITFIRAEPMTLFFAYAFTLLAMAVFAVSYLGGRWMQYALFDYAARFAGLIASLIVRPVVFSAESHKAREEMGIKPSKRNLWPVLRGIVIALPVVAVFAALLSSADAVFGEKLQNAIQLFRLEKLPEYIFRFVYILVIGYGLAGVILHAASQSKEEKLASDGKPLVPPFLGFTESAIVLGSVVALFASFVVVQFQYFFGGQANIHYAGYTYSEYAVKGFTELMVVAFISLVMLLSLSAATKRESDFHRRVFSGLGVALVALLMVILFSAYQRLALYESVYGFSRLRAYTHVLLVWIGLLLVATIVLEILRRERAFAFAAVVASLGFVISLSLLNVDNFIVRQNVGRATQGDGLDVPYLVSLSSDAVPALVDIYQSPNYPDMTRDAVGAILFCRAQTESERSDNDWRAFTFSRWQADNALKEIQGKLDKYTVKDADWPIKIHSPAGVLYTCYDEGH